MKYLLTVIFILTFFSVEIYSQVVVSYFPFQSILSVSSDTDNMFWGDYKIETNTFFSNLNMELSLKYNVIRNERVNYYFGPGIGFNPVNGFSDLPVTNGYFMDFGVRIRPLSQPRNLQIVFEISTYSNREFTGGNLRTRIGAAWNF